MWQPAGIGESSIEPASIAEGKACWTFDERFGETTNHIKATVVDTAGNIFEVEEEFDLAGDPQHTSVPDKGNGSYDGAEPLGGDNVYQEPYTDTNENGTWDEGEPYEDLNGNGQYESEMAFWDRNANGLWDPAENYTDIDGDGHYDHEEPYTDSNGNEAYDEGEPYSDNDGDGHRDRAEPFDDRPDSTLSFEVTEPSAPEDDSKRFLSYPLNPENMGPGYECAGKAPQLPVLAGTYSTDSIYSSYKHALCNYNLSGTEPEGMTTLQLVDGFQTFRRWDSGYYSSSYVVSSRPHPPSWGWDDETKQFVMHPGDTTYFITVPMDAGYSYSGWESHSYHDYLAYSAEVHILIHGSGEPYTDSDGDGKYDAQDEPYTDANDNGQFDPGEPYEDLDGDGHYDGAESYSDVDGNGEFTRAFGWIALSGQPPAEGLVRKGESVRLQLWRFMTEPVDTPLANVAFSRPGGPEALVLPAEHWRAEDPVRHDLDTGAFEPGPLTVTATLGECGTTLSPPQGASSSEPHELGSYGGLSTSFSFDIFTLGICATDAQGEELATEYAGSAYQGPDLYVIRVQEGQPWAHRFQCAPFLPVRSDPVLYFPESTSEKNRGRMSTFCLLHWSTS